MIYARISRDAQAEGLGVGRQIDDCRKLAARLGYEVVEELHDNDISASTHSKRVRPQYATMLTMARAGQIDAILAYSNSRLTRRVREYLDLIDVINTHRVAIKTVVSGDHDLSTADGRAVALTIATWDQAEAERTAERVKRAKKQMAEKGEYRGGRRPYGYEAGGLVLREAEAKFVRHATREVIAGRSLRGLTAELNAAGARTSTGKLWTVVQLRDVLTRPRNMGYLSHGQVGRQGFEIAGKAIWEPIVDEDTWRAMFDVLTDPSRRTTTGGDAKWLGSGIYRCGICAGVLRATRSGRTKKMHYRCQDFSHLLVAQEHIDRFVCAAIVTAVNDPRVVVAMNPQSPNLAIDRDARAVEELKLARFERDYADGLITGAQLQKATSSTVARISELDERLAKAIQRTAASPIMRASNPGASFLDAPIDIQRAVLTTIFRVKVLSAKQAGIGPGQSWNSGRVVITPAEPVNDLQSAS